MRGLQRLCLAGIVAITMAQTIEPTNMTALGGDDVALQISTGGHMMALAPVIPLTPTAANDIPPPGLSGSIFLVNATSVLLADSRDIATISCDEIPGDLQADYLFRQAVQLNATAVLFYSETSEACMFTDPDETYPWIYTMRSTEATERLLDVKDDSDEAREELWAQVSLSSMLGNGSDSENGGRDLGSYAGEGAGDDDDGDEGQNALGPSPSTAVAMIILYSVTGIITALFLVIIVTGAMRAHRHPERYGPRNVIGRPRQSRAKGIARAMLDTLPIVKTGQRDEEHKPSDIELAQPRSETSEARGSAEQQQDANTAVPTIPPVQQDGTSDTAADIAAPRRASTNEDGIAAAVTGAAPNPDHLGCSICTEDFQPGQDQRVLPCDHRFHPDCVDPWLLNVSGTCPLCRIDLHPPPEEPTYDANGNEIPRSDNPAGGANGENGAEMPPPLGMTDNAQRMSIRRSIAYGLMGPRRPERMTREERVDALRQWRDRQVRERENAAAMRYREAARRAANAPAQAEDADADGSAAVEEGSRVPRRLRGLFGIRTRRTGDPSQRDGT